MSITSRALLLVLAAALLPGCAETQTGTSAGGAVIEGSQDAMTLDELASVADAVVLAVAGDETERAFADNARIPAEDRDEVGYEGSRYVEVPLSVEAVLSGSIANAPTVARLKTLVEPGGSAEVDASDIQLAAGERYLLFLSVGDQLWTGHYLALGVQGIARINGDVAEFRTGTSMPVAAALAAVRRE